MTWQHPVNTHHPPKKQYMLRAVALHISKSVWIEFRDFQKPGESHGQSQQSWKMPVKINGVSNGKCPLFLGGFVLFMIDIICII